MIIREYVIQHIILKYIKIFKSFIIEYIMNKKMIYVLIRIDM
jgi:hypothetical protein